MSVQLQISQEWPTFAANESTGFNEKKMWRDQGFLIIILCTPVKM